MNQAWNHFKTITRHRNLVMRHCFKVGLYRRGLLHDLSKYGWTEFRVGMKYYQGTRSPNAAEREDQGWSTAWMHHKGRNKHHFEYWNDLNTKSGYYESVPMPLNYVKEMFCDRVAASKIYKGKNYTDRVPLDYFLNSRARQRMHKETADLLENWLTFLAEKGEKEAFLYLKKLK